MSGPRGVIAIALAAGMAVLPAPPCYGEGAGGAAPLTWPDCVALARRRNPDLASSERAKESARHSLRGSFNGFLPGLTLSNSYSDAGGGSNAGADPSWQAQASLSLDLLNAGRAADIRSAAAALKMAEAGARQASALLRFNLRKAFLQLLFARESVAVSGSIQDMRRRSAQLVKLRYDSGRESKGNMLRAQAQLLQADADLAQSRRELRTARGALGRQLGVDDFSSIDISGDFDVREPPDLPDDPRPLLPGRPDVAVQEAAEKIAEAGLGRARGALWPALSAGYARTRRGPREFPSESAGWNLSGVLSYPLFSGGPTAAYHAVAAAERTLEKSAQDLRAARAQAIVEIENAWSAFAGAADQAKVQAALLESARQRNSEADIRYASGLLTYDSWEIIASDRVGQERQAVLAKVNASIAAAAWDKALGASLEE